MSKRTYPSGYAKRKAAIYKEVKSEDDLFTQQKLTSFFNLPQKISAFDSGSDRCNVDDHDDNLLDENYEQCSSGFVCSEDSFAVDELSTNQKDTEVTEHDILAKGTAAESVESVPSTDPALWEVIDEDLRAYWVRRGPSSCQNSDSDFSKSARVYDKIKGVSNKTRLFQKSYFTRKLHNGEVVNRE